MRGSIVEVLAPEAPASCKFEGELRAVASTELSLERRSLLRGQGIGYPSCGFEDFF